MLIVLIVLGVGWGAVGAFQARDKIRINSGGPAVQFARIRFERDLCIDRAIRSAVPHGALVWVAPEQNVYWRNSLGPMSTPNHEVVRDRQPGAYSLAVVSDGPDAPSGIRCEGSPRLPYPPVVLVAREIPETER